MKRKLTTLLFAMLLLICTVAGLAACDIDTGAGRCEHSYSEWTEKTAATCTVNGEETRTCDKCGNTETRSTDALGHDFSEEWTNDESGHWHACKNTGCTAKSNEAEHSDHDHYCYYCDYKTSEHEYTLIEYSWSGNDYCEAVRTCEKCSADAEGHTEKAVATVTSTITQNKTCTLPELTKYTATFDVEWAQTQIKENVETASALGHEYDETGTPDENGHYHVCTHDNCDKKSTYAEIDKNNDYACDICGEALLVKLEADVAALVGDGSKNSVDVSLNLHKNADSSIFIAIVDGLANAKDGSVNVILSGVETIPYGAFYCCTALKSVILSDSVTSIECGAFYNCSALESVGIGSGVKTIEDDAFRDCSALETLTLQEGIESIGHSAFRGCTSLQSVVIPDSVTSISYNVFYQCTSLTTLIIGSGVTSMGTYVFGSCSALENLTIKEGVTIIANGTFYGCSALKSVEIPDSVTTIGDKAFYECSALTTLTVGSVETIGEQAFESCEKLETLTLKEGVKTIGISAFEGCASLKSVVIPDSVTSIGGYAFYQCTSLATLTVGSGVEEMDERTFSECTSLTTITLKEGMKAIGWRAFRDCTALTTVTIPDSVTTIGDDAFKNCSNVTEFTIGSGMTEIGNNIFNGQNSLTNLTFRAPITNTKSLTFDGVDTENITLNLAKGQRCLRKIYPQVGTRRRTNCLRTA